MSKKTGEPNGANRGRLPRSAAAGASGQTPVLDLAEAPALLDSVDTPARWGHLTPSSGHAHYTSPAAVFFCSGNREAAPDGGIWPAMPATDRRLRSVSQSVQPASRRWWPSSRSRGQRFIHPSFIEQPPSGAASAPSHTRVS